MPKDKEFNPAKGLMDWLGWIGRWVKGESSAQTEGAAGDSTARLVVAEKAALRIRKLLLTPLPKLPDNPGLISEGERQRLAAEIADAIYSGIERTKIDSYDRVAIYLPQEIAYDFREIFPHPDGSNLLEETCQRRLFAQRLGAEPSKKVHLMSGISGDLNFHPAFAEILQNRLAVRFLAADDVLISPEPSQCDPDLVQLLIGAIEIDEGSRRVAKEPIWAYRVGQNRPRIAVNMDFDLLAKGFPWEHHQVPLGIDIRCMFQEGVNRKINEISLDFTEAVFWLDQVSDYKYELSSRGVGSANWVGVRDYTKSSRIYKIPTEASSYSYDISETGRIPIDRTLVFRAGVGNRIYTYTCGFFTNALSFDPTRNNMRVTGQLVPSVVGTEVTFAPGALKKASTAFKLRPVAGTTDEFEITVPPFPDHRLELGSAAIAPGSPTRCRLNDTIVATPNQGSQTAASKHTFTIEGVQDMPDEVLNAQAGRSYCAFVKVESPGDRSFRLSEAAHVFGTKSHFPEKAFGMTPGGLRFERPYVTLKMRPGKSQNIYYVPSAAPRSPTGKAVAQLLPQDGLELFLNADYTVYFGDYQITLNLKVTPQYDEATAGAGHP